MKKVIFILGILLIVFLGVGFLYGKKILRIHPAQPTVKTVEKTEVISSHPSIPEKLSIPSLNIQAEVESVGLDRKRNMDVPKNPLNVAWYNLGAKPGEKGNAVLAGHLDTVTGDPAVFFNLKNLKKGDLINVKDSKGNEFLYEVVSKGTYPSDGFPLQKVFGKTDKFMLNLITCEGTFDSEKKNYSHRTVVHSELKK